MMNGNCKIWICIVFSFFIAFIAFTAVASAETHYYVYPGESIQAAVNAASAGDMIIIYNETYCENVVVDNSITLQGEGRDITIIDTLEENLSENLPNKNTDVTLLNKENNTKIVVDTIADFNYINNKGKWHPNNWGGNFGLIYALGGCCTQSRDINNYNGCFGASLRLDYNVTKGFAGWYTKFQWSPTEYDKDLSDYEELHFWVKGDPINGCTSTFKVEFKDCDTVGEYIVEGVNTSWQEIIINLSRDVSPQPNWEKMDEFTIVFEDWRVTEKKGTLYVDDIQFVDTNNQYYNTDNEFLDFVAEKAFMYFWETAQTAENTNNTSYGLIPDTTGNVGWATYDRKSSIAGNGFGLTALCIGAERGWISKSEAEERVYKTLLSHRNIQLKQSQNSSLWGKYGFFYHFLDINPNNGIENNGQRDGNTEVSSIDTALVIAGVITAGEYFGYNESIKNLAEEIYNAVQWNKFFNTTLNQFYMGWKPEYKNDYTVPAPDGGYFTGNISIGWNGTWDIYTDETLLICLLAAGAPNESYRVSINDSFYSFNKRSWENCSYLIYPYPNGTKIISSWTGSLFTYFFAHCWWDFRNKDDSKDVNWWNNSVNAALANKYYCNEELKNKFQTYNNTNCWGVTACSGNCSYLEKVAKPCWCCNASCPISGQPSDEGTLAPYGAISCMPFFSSNKSENPSFQSLKHYVEKSDQKLWNQYGPVDSFDLGTNSSCKDDWYAPGYLAIGVGPMLIGIHNYRAINDQNISSTYDWFMNNTHIKMVDETTFNNIKTIDTGSSENPYPSIMGTHKGEIKPSDSINVSKLYTYPCVGTGGHTESIKLYENGELIASGTWTGYRDDYHNITITPSVTLLAGHTYNYTIVTGSYPQIIHAESKDVTGGTITCTSFVDANGKTYNDWIPAIRLE